MSRDHRKLRVFHDAHALTISIYRETSNFPRDEWYGMRQQMRRAATSVPTNIVEGSARRTTREYGNFLNVALGSACEVTYLVQLACDLGFLQEKDSVLRQGMSVVRQLQRLVTEVERLMVEDHGAEPRDRSAGPRAVARSPKLRQLT
jgi:four helix bundle protein